MNLLSKLTDRCTYWAPGPSGKSGQPTYQEPVELRCHWEDHQLVVTDSAGRQWMSKAEVLLDTPVEEKGYLFHGRRLELTDDTNPKANKDAAEIVALGSVPNVPSHQTVYTAYL